MTKRPTPLLVGLPSMRGRLVLYPDGRAVETIAIGRSEAEFVLMLKLGRKSLPW